MANKYVPRTVTSLGTYNVPTDPLWYYDWVRLGHDDGLYHDMATGAIYRISYPVVMYIGNIKDLE